MANDDHIAQLMKHASDWNRWREKNPNIRPDLSRFKTFRCDDWTDTSDFSFLRELREICLGLFYKYFYKPARMLGITNRFTPEPPDLWAKDLSGADLSEANLAGLHLTGPFSAANLRGADLSGAICRGNRFEEANLSEANLNKADLRWSNLRGAHLNKADLRGANLGGANLQEANLSGADLSEANLQAANLQDANLQDANLSGADLMMANLALANLARANLRGALLNVAQMVGTDITEADLTGCRIYGVSAWNLKLEGAKQQNLVITRRDEPEITVDNIEVAQFVYLLLHNQKIRDIIDTITSKAVLILGRFTDERKTVLDALREELRKRNYLPILFDFSVPATRDITETISLLARMARFVVADITDAKSIPQELGVIVPDLPSVPVQPLLLEGSTEYGMFEHFRRYPWVLETYRYPSTEHLITDLAEHVIGPAEKYARSVREATPQMGARPTGSR